LYFVFGAKLVASVLYTGIVTLTEFAQYVIHDWSNATELDRHWRAQHEICNPCFLKYDFIGRFENLKQDADHILATLAASGGPNITFPFLNAFNKTVPSVQQLKTFYAKVPSEILRKLVRIYKLDYELFGYDYRWACSDC